MSKYVIGVDYGTDSARAVIVDASNGATLSTAVCYYPRWKQGKYCDPSKNMYRQHPLDYIEAMETVIKESLAGVDPEVRENVVGIAFDTTGSTPCFVDMYGEPLALRREFSENPNAMFVLWKDHTAIAEAAEINEACKKADVDFSKYEGGIYSSEWFWSKVIHIMREDPAVAEAAYSVVEHCEWMPALLTGVTRADKIVRSRCAHGHKAMWHPDWNGLPSEEFLTSIEPALKGLREHLFCETFTADKPVGTLSPEWAAKFDLSTNVVVAGGALDAHFGAVGANAAPNTMVRVIGTSTCDMITATYQEMEGKLIPGICGQVDGSIVPGFIGLEAGQSAFGDIYAWLKRFVETPACDIINRSNSYPPQVKKALVDEIKDGMMAYLTREAEKVTPEQSCALATDYFNGRRTPDADQTLKGTITNLTLGTTAPMVYRALVEATAYGSRAIMERFKSEGVRIDAVIGIGGIALKSPFVMQTLSNVMGVPIKVCKTDQACALGAAMVAATASGIYKSVSDAQAAMNSGYAKEYVPEPAEVERYDKLYCDYIALTKKI